MNLPRLLSKYIGLTSYSICVLGLVLITIQTPALSDSLSAVYSAESSFALE